MLVDGDALQHRDEAEDEGDGRAARMGHAGHARELLRAVASPYTNIFEFARNVTAITIFEYTPCFPNLAFFGTRIFPTLVKP